MKSKGSKI